MSAETGLAASSSPAARDVADAMLAANGNAVDAVLAGIFALAGDDPAALLAPMTMLVVGRGVGARALDGRSIQPGIGATRPRGYRTESEIPLAARVAVPRGILAALLAHTRWGKRSLSETAAQGVSRASAAGAKERAAFLKEVGRIGGAAIFGAREAILTVANPYANGLLTEDDLSAAAPADVSATSIESAADTGEILQIASEPPSWSQHQVSEQALKQKTASLPETVASPATIIAVADGNGLVACCSIFTGASEIDGRTLEVERLGVALPLSGSPVRRGTPRVPAGTVHPVVATLVSLESVVGLRVAAGFSRGAPAMSQIAKAIRRQPIADAWRSLSGAASESGASGSPIVAFATERVRDTSSRDDALLGGPIAKPPVPKKPARAK